MKLIIRLIGILFISNVYASTKHTFATNDSLAINYQLDEVDQLLLYNYAETQLHLLPLQTQELSNQQHITILGRFFKWIGDFFTPVWGQYREPYHRENGPYMTFQYDEYGDLQKP